MAEKFKLAVGDIVEFPVSLKLTGEDGTTPTIKIHFQGDRLGADQYRKEIKDEDGPVGEWLLSHLKGWRGQRIVLTDEGKPAEFSRSALAYLFNGLPGADVIVFHEYRKALFASDGAVKN